MTLYNFLVYEKHYSKDEAEETCIRFELSGQPGMEIPKEIKKDIKEYYSKYYAKVVKK